VATTRRVLTDATQHHRALYVLSIGRRMGKRRKTPAVTFTPEDANQTGEDAAGALSSFSIGQAVELDY